MDKSKTNISALNFSPHFWWKTIERGINFTEGLGKSLYAELNYRDWFQTATIEHPSLDIYDTEANGTPHSAEYAQTVSNNYYFEVIAKSRYGHKVSAKSLEKLYANATVGEDAEITYSFKIDELQHLATLHFMNWLLLGTDFHWVRWQLYFDFIAYKIDPPLMELYYYMWSIIMGEVDFHHKFFETVEQYKLFRDKYDEISKVADIAQNKFVTLREAGKMKPKRTPPKRK